MASRPSEENSPTNGQRAVGYALFGIAGAAVALGIVVVLYAFLFSGGYEAIPEGAGQQALWFASAYGGLVAAVFGLAAANAQIVRGEHGRAAVAWVAVAVCSYTAWWELAELFR